MVEGLDVARADLPRPELVNPGRQDAPGVEGAVGGGGHGEVDKVVDREIGRGAVDHVDADALDGQPGSRVGDRARDAAARAEDEVEGGVAAGRNRDHVGGAGRWLVIEENEAEVCETGPHPVGLQGVEVVDRVAPVGGGRRAGEEAV